MNGAKENRREFVLEKKGKSNRTEEEALNWIGPA
jgi:hypothetical protein